QAEDGIRDFHVTGVQTCALPISHPHQIGLISLITDLMRVRAVQLTAAAAVLLALAQMGKMITGESMTPKTRHENTVALEEYRSEIGRASGRERVQGVVAFVCVRK